MAIASRPAPNPKIHMAIGWLGELVVSGEKLEPNPIPGKRGSIAVNVQAAHDSDFLYMRFQWEDAEFFFQTQKEKLICIF